MRGIMLLLVLGACVGCDDGSVCLDPALDCGHGGAACELWKAADDGEVKSGSNLGVCLDVYGADSFACVQGCSSLTSCSPGEVCIPLDGPPFNAPRATGACIPLGAQVLCQHGETVATSEGPAYVCRSW